MKLRDIVSSITKNKRNNQLNFSLKKKKLKEFEISEEDILDLKLHTPLKRLLD